MRFVHRHNGVGCLRRRLTADELVESHRVLPGITYDRMRDEADESFGTEDRVEDEVSGFRAEGVGG